MTPSEWLSRNLSQVLVAVAQAGAALAGSQSPTAGTNHSQEGSQDAGTV